MSKLDALRETRSKALAEVGAILDEHGVALETRRLTDEEIAKREDATKRPSPICRILIAAEEVRESRGRSRP